MNPYLIGILIGAGGGIVLTPIILVIWNLIKNTKQRRQAKKLLKQGKFLKPMDIKDYDSEAWKEEINIEENKNSLEYLNTKIFEKKVADDKLKEQESSNG